ncbi:neuropeptide FF receptor 2-like [Exaiptasia diaphana]|uniref:G-protein coupled receptors family 1 profile domain-containing protein n=1 Tax=Exaiptasia diaphana TaxID=2652724 RepID=A0A913WZ36_EXADI|nr:neuropeptide FF receptor 2-like [Exaiptasia diaphana]
MQIFGWAFILEAVAITAVNAATIVIFTRTNRLHSKQYIMIISQAVADLFVGLVAIPVFGVSLALNEDPRTSSTFKQVFLTTDSLFVVASMVGLAALAIERAHATYFPFRHSTLSKGPYIIGIILMWAAPISVAVLYTIFDPPDAVNSKLAVTVLAVVIIVSAYSLIVFKVRYRTTQAHDVTIQENKKLTVTLAVVTTLSLVMWLPFQCLGMAGVLKGSSPFIYFPAKFLQYGNSLVNSVVYAFRMREIKREILRTFLCCRNNQISINNETLP